MAKALGVADREAMDGILRQLVKASVSGGRRDEVTLSFMISMVKSIKPRDSVEAMLVAQMVSVHAMAMRCAHYLANADDLAQHDSAARALGRLVLSPEKIDLAGAPPPQRRLADWQKNIYTLYIIHLECPQRSDCFEIEARNRALTDHETMSEYPTSVLTTVNAPYSRKLNAPELAYCPSRDGPGGARTDVSVL
jgi:hypothetical protein